MIYLRFILFFLLFLGSILFVVRKLRFSQALAPLVVILGNTLILYIFSLCNLLLTGTYFLIGINLLMGVLSFINLPKLKEGREFKFGFALIAWTAIFFILIAFTRDLELYSWDEFSFWGAFTKYLLATNHLPDAQSNFLYINYPPFMGLFQYFVSTVVGKQEAVVYFSHMLLNFSALLAIFPGAGQKNWKKSLFFFLVGALSIVAVDLKFQSLYVDLPIGLLFAVALATIGFTKKLSSDGFVVVLFSATAMTLMKPLSPFFSFVVLAYLFYKMVREFYSSVSNGKLLASLFQPFKSLWFLLLLLIPIATTISWSVHLAPYSHSSINITMNDVPTVGSLTNQELELKTNSELLGEPRQINFSIKGFLNIFSVNADNRTKLIINSFVSKIFATPYYAFPITIVEIVIFAILLSMLFARLAKAHAPYESKAIQESAVFLGISWGAYTLLLLFLYIYYFFPSEAVSTPCLDRYSSSFLIGWWLYILSFGYSTDSVKIPLLDLKAIDAIIGVILIGLLIKMPVQNYFHYPYTPDSQRKVIEEMYLEVSSDISSGDEKVYIVFNNDFTEGFSHLLMKYYLIPLPSNNFGWDLGETNNEVNLYKVDFSMEEWMQLLQEQDYTHVLICSADDAFWKNYGDLFDSYSTTHYPQLFLVTSKLLIRLGN